MANRMFPLLIAGALALTITGCGKAAPSSKKVATPSSRSTSTPPSPTSRSTPSSGTRTTSSTPSSPSRSKPTEVTPPPPPAGIYSEMTIAVKSVIAEGKTQANGQALSVFLLNIAVTNPTSGIVPLHLNDLTVEPENAAHYQYSNTDQVKTGLTAQNSLFPWPVNASSPGSVIVYVHPGETVSGDITVAVPAQSRYQIVWGGSNRSVVTFQAP